MQPYQERVIQEKAQLDDRITALTIFLDGPVFQAMSDQKQQLLLVRQRNVMREYSDILGQRISAF